MLSSVGSPFLRFAVSNPLPPLYVTTWMCSINHQTLQQTGGSRCLRWYKQTGPPLFFFFFLSVDKVSKQTSADRTTKTNKQTKEKERVKIHIYQHVHTIRGPSGDRQVRTVNEYQITPCKVCLFVCLFVCFVFGCLFWSFGPLPGTKEDAGPIFVLSMLDHSQTV